MGSWRRRTWARATWTAAVIATLVATEIAIANTPDEFDLNEYVEIAALVFAVFVWAVGLGAIWLVAWLFNRRRRRQRCNVSPSTPTS